MYKLYRPLPFDTFLVSYNQIYGKGKNIEGTALFFTKDFQNIPPYIIHTMIRSNIIYEDNVLVSIRTTEKPYGVNYERVENLAHGLSGIIIKHGYMEIVDVDAMFKKNGIKEKVIFHGLEDISSKNPLLKFYGFLKKVTPSFVQFYTLPYNKLHGVVTRQEI